MIYDSITVEMREMQDSIIVSTPSAEVEEGANSSFSEATDDNLMDEGSEEGILDEDNGDDDEMSED